MNGESSKILVVDDDPFVRQLMEYVLESEGYTVETAEDGAQALQMWTSGAEGIDAVISDMNMPEMNGLELVKALRDAGVDVPILLLTGDGDAPIAEQALKNGASGYLVKDENIEDTLPDALKEILEGYRKKTVSS